MKSNLVFTKTAKGLGESVGKTKNLPRSLRELLKRIDGHASVGDIRSAAGLSDNWLKDALAQLLRDDYIREFSKADEEAYSAASLGQFQATLSQVTLNTYRRIMGIDKPAGGASPDDAWKATAPDTLSQGNDTQGLVESVRRSQEDYVRQAPVQKAVQPLPRAAYRKPEPKAGNGKYDDGIFNEIAELAEREEADIARREQEAQEMEAAEARRREQTEAYHRRMDEEKARIRAKRRARREARERARQEELQNRRQKKKSLLDKGMDKLGAAADVPHRLARKIWIALPAVLVIAVAVIPYVSFSDRAHKLEKEASVYLQQPVTIGSLHVALLPYPHWRAEKVSVGNAGQIRIAEVRTRIAAGLFGGKQARVELVSPELSEEGLGWMLFSAPQASGAKPQSVSVTKARVKSDNIVLGDFNARVDIGEGGRWSAAVIDTVDRQAHLALEANGTTVKFDMTAESFALPFGATVKLDKFHAEGVLREGELRVGEFRGSLYDGSIGGNALLTWWQDWSLSGDFNVAGVNAARVAPHMFESGSLKSTGKYFARSEAGSKLLVAPRIVGNIRIANGTLTGIDLMNAVRSPKSGGRSVFSEMTGNFTYASRKLQLQGLYLKANLMSAVGNAEVDAVGKLNGVFGVDLTSPSANEHADLVLGGTLTDPQFAAR